MKIVLSGNYGADNFGDEMILEGLLTTFRHLSPYSEITVLSEKPIETKNKYEIMTARKFPAGFRSFFGFIKSGDFAKTKKEVKECDYFVLGGGGLFDGTSFKGAMIWAIQAFFAYHYKKKVIMYGQSVSSISSSKNPILKLMVKRLFKKASFIAVRDFESKIELEKLGITDCDTRKILIMPDLIFKLEFPQHEYKDEEKNTVLVCLRDNKKKNEISEALKSCQRDGEYNKIIFLPFSKQDESSEEYSENKDKIADKYKKAKLVIGMRLHGILMAIVTGIPFIAISYSPKVRNALESLGLSEFVIDIKDATTENLTEMIKKIKDSLGLESQLKSKLKEVTEKQIQKHKEIELELSKLLGHELRN